MKTIVTSSYAQAAGVIRQGGIAAFPTETVYGLGANALDPKAVKKIFRAKGRPSDNPLIVHVHSKSQIAQVAREITPLAQKIIDSMFPGPVSIVLKKRREIPKEVTSGLDTVCVRMPSMPIARKFLKACGVPVAAPSANLSGKPSPTDYSHVLDDFNGRIPIILKGPKSSFGLESTVVDCTGAKPIILRSGSTSSESIMEIAGIMGKQGRDAANPEKQPRAPGMKYRHYAPSGKVIIVKSPSFVPLGARNWAYIGMSRPKNSKKASLCVIATDKREYARKLFAFFRSCDRQGIGTAYCQEVGGTGIGRAIMERLSKASKGGSHGATTPD
ncbi:MAG TPA: L-threonylcarbamoyladenylate synthase, partial [Candidatus Micrarchaeota archaeon]|nr:L-threonylcarbamoyladenylate synthase [Candidatus Micrarchaeota archaeon]